jgi:hypothetical protein
MKNCDSESGWTLEEETTKPGLVKDGEWNVINVRFAILDHAKDPCGVPVNLGNRKMKIMIYVNGYLVLVSRELNEFRFRPLKVKSKFQEGVPFNISLGGGTQGLADMITPNYKEVPEVSYYLEDTYAGTFIGDIRVFKMYTCFMQYEEIKNNYILETGKEHPEPDMVKNNILYYGFDINYEHVITSGIQKLATKELRSKYNATSEYEDAHFYVIISKNYIGTKPLQFTCGGAPMVMNEIETTIYNAPCIVYESGEIYAPGTELLILSDNF